jgi:hypothetical protein
MRMAVLSVCAVVATSYEFSTAVRHIAHCARTLSPISRAARRKNTMDRNHPYPAKRPARRARPFSPLDKEVCDIRFLMPLRLPLAAQRVPKSTILKLSGKKTMSRQMQMTAAGISVRIRLSLSNFKCMK